MDEEGKTGCLSLDDFLQVINSRDLGFQLEEHELAFIATQVMTTSSIELIPRILVILYVHCMYMYILHLLLEYKVR